MVFTLRAGLTAQSTRQYKVKGGICDLGAQFFFKLFIYLSMASLGLCGFAGASFSCCKWALLFFGVHRLFTVVASLVQSTGSRSTGLGVGP